MDMQFWWLHCQESQDKFCYYWDAGSNNWANYNRTEQLRKVGNFIDYYLDEFNQNGVFIRHKQRVAK